jgi:glycosyltransferase involved in cell wall biosynthesis
MLAYEPLRIAYIYDPVYPFVKGGAEMRLFEVTRRMAERGHDVHWFSLKWWDGEQTMKMGEVTLHGVSPKQSLYVNGRRSVVEAFRFSGGVLRHLNGRFDLIDCQEFPYLPCFSAKAISGLNGIPLVVTWHEVWDGYWNSYLGPLGYAARAVERAAMHLTSWNLAVSRATASELQRFNVRPHVIENGINISLIEEAPCSPISSDVIFAGRLVRAKNVDLLIRAIHEIKKSGHHLRLIIAGDGPDRPRLQELSKALEVSSDITFTGFLESQKDLFSLMKSSKLFVLPSSREGFGIVVLEANACGLPVVTLRHPQNAAIHLVDGHNGMTATAEDLSSAIIKCLFKAEGMRQHCLRSAKGRDWDAVCDRIEAFYRNVIDG